MQIPPFALNTKGAWVLRFDDIIADALELGALQTEETPLISVSHILNSVFNKSFFHSVNASFKFGIFILSEGIYFDECTDKKYIEKEIKPIKSFIS